MIFCASCLLFLSAILSAHELSAMLVSALFCLLLSFWVRFFGGKRGGFRLLFALSLVLRLVPLWEVFAREFGTVKAGALFVLMLAVVAISAKRQFLQHSALPIGLLALTVLIFVLWGTFAPPVIPDRPSVLALSAAVICPLSSALTLPQSKTILSPLLGAVTAALAALVTVYFDFPLWEGILSVCVSPFCAACELRMLSGKQA